MVKEIFEQAMQGIEDKFAEEKSKNVALTNDVQSANDEIKKISNTLKSTNEELGRVNAAYEELLKKPQPAKLPRRGAIGMNWHPGDASYKGNTAKAMEATKYIGADRIRVDVDVIITPGPDFGKMKLHDLYTKEIIPACQSEKVGLRMMLYDRGYTSKDSKEVAVEKGRALTDAFLQRYAPFITSGLELANEAAADALLTNSEYDAKYAGVTNKPSRTGLYAGAYDDTRIDRVTDFISGMYRGALKYPVDLFIDSTWLHFYFIQMLRDKGVNTFYSHHWYTDAENNKDLINFIKRKDINGYIKDWLGRLYVEVGETSYMPKKGVGSMTEAEEVSFAQSFMPLFRSNLNAGLDQYLFELVDRTQFGAEPREGILGYYRKDWTARPIVEMIREELTKWSY